MKRFFKIFFLSLGILVVVFISYFLLIKKLDSNVMEMKMPASSQSGANQAILLPSQFIDGQRFYIKMAAGNGDTILAFGDTGGGLSMALPTLIDKLHLDAKVRTGLLKGIMPMKYLLFRDVVPYASIPAPGLVRDKVLRHPFAMITDSYLFVPALDGETRSFIETMTCDIFLGQNFFMGHAWTFDYIHGQVWVNTPIAAGEEGMAGVQKITFKKNRTGDNVFGHARMYIEVNGEVIAVLYDSGATFVLSEEGKKYFSTTDKTMAGSFIAASIFDRWRKEHPDWKYYPKADAGSDVLEVPVVKIGGYEVGPVLFSRRNDEVWSQGMIMTMDKVVKGAIGGSALKYFKVTMDYNSELIKFEK